MKLFFIVPGLSEKYRSGGLIVLQDLAKLFGALPGVECRFVTTHENNGTLSPLSPAIAAVPAFFIVSWGPLVSEHIKLIRSHNPNARIIYYAQSFGWGVKLPPKIPIICVSKYVAEKWRAKRTENPITVIPPPLNPIFSFEESLRNIDILVHTRKQNEYCLKKLLPALIESKKYTVEILDRWVPQPEFAALLKRTKLFLYLTAPHTHGRIFKKTFAEGFGLPALEATACGALVGSNLLGGVNDFLTPGENCIELGNGNLENDVEKIVHALGNFRPHETAAEKTAASYSPAAILKKWREEFF